MKRLILFFLAMFAVAVMLLGCSETEDPLGIEHENSQPVTLVGSAASNQVVVNLMAGSDFSIGTLTCRLEDETLYFDYATEEDWTLVATHLDVAESLEGIPVLSCGIPKLHLFPLKTWHFPFVPEFGYAVDLADWGLEDADEVFVAAHAFALKLSETGWIEAIASAWGEGEYFPKTWDDSKPRVGETELEGGLGVPGDWEKLSGVFPEDQRTFMEMQGYGWEDFIHIGRPMYFTVNISQLKGLILWNKLGSVEEIENSEVGPDGIIVGDIEYLPCQHGSGFKPLERTGDPNIPDNYITFSGLDLGPQGCLEFWYHPDWIDWHVGHVVSLFVYGVYDDPYNQPLQMGYNDWQNLFGGTSFGPDNSYTIGTFRSPASIPGWSITEPFHIAMMWDAIRVDISERFKVFINGEEMIPTRFVYRGDPDFAGWSPEAVFHLGCRAITGDWSRHHWEGSEGIIDNIKIWNYPKTDFADRFTE